MRSVYSAVILLIAGALISCSTSEPTPELVPLEVEVEVATPDVEALPAEQLPGVQGARLILSQQRQVEPEEITVVEAEAVTWPDTCLGVETTGEPCTNAETEGYRVVLSLEGEEFTYRTDAFGGQVYLVDGPEMQTSNAAITWEDLGPRGCRTASFTMETVLFGPCDGPLMEGAYILDERVQDLNMFIDTYAPFEAETRGGIITFEGEGIQQASEIEQRMIAEWAGLTAIEAEAGQAGAAYGAIIAWASAGQDGAVDSMQVFSSGEAIVVDCTPDRCADPERVRLNEEQLAILYGWSDKYDSYEQGLNTSLPPVAFVFTGEGIEPAEPETRANMQRFAQNLFDTTIENISP